MPIRLEQHLPGIVAVLARDGGILLSNHSFEALPDRNPSSPSKERIKGACQRVIEMGRAEVVEIGEVGPTGPVCCFQCEVRPIRDGDGNVIAAAASCLDVTPRKAEEERLRRSEALLVDAQGVAHLGTWEWTIGQPDVVWSQELYQIYGVTPATFKPTFEGFLARVHPEDRGRISDVMTRVMAERISFSHDERIIRPDGSMRHLHSWGHPVFDRGGNIIRLIGVCQDVTERRHAEEKLQAEERLRALIFETVSDALFYLRVEGPDRFRFSYVNDAFLRTTGLGQEQVVGRSIEEVVPPASLAMVLDHYRRAIRERRACHWDEKSVHSAEARYGEVSVTPVFEDDRCVGLVGTVHDVTERRRDEERIAQLYAEAQRAVQVREDFISIASHELRTPLTPLMMQLDLLTHFLQEEAIVAGPKAQELRKLIADCDKQIVGLARLVDDMLDASRLRTGHLTLSREDIDLGRLVTEVIGRLRAHPKFAKPVAIELNLASLAPAPHGHWDRLRLEQVVTNLLSNAFKYGGGKAIGIVVSVKGDTAILSVQDSGIGIAKEDQSIIFERFGRAPSMTSVGGLGMGLYITRQIVEAHGGRITLESAPGEGSTFTVELPRGHERGG